jgi:hypothetical protein
MKIVVFVQGGNFVTLMKRAAQTYYCCPFFY